MDTSSAKPHAPPAGRLVLGGFLILAGLWLLLDQMGLDLPGLETLWPLLLLAGGSAFFYSWIQNGYQPASAVWFGTAGVLSGAFFLVFATGLVGWWKLGELWPTLLVIGGLAFLATWRAAGAKDPVLLVPATLGIFLGGMGLAATQGWYEMIFPALDILWPLVLMAFGVVLIWRGVKKSRGSDFG